MSVFILVALAVGVICNSISIIILSLRLRSLRRRSRFSVGDLIASNRLQAFSESMRSPSVFSDRVSHLYRESDKSSCESFES